MFTKCRCHICHKKTFEYKCRCNDEISFCSKHRYAEEHNCTFDYKEKQKEKIVQENPKVENQKILSF